MKKLSKEEFCTLYNSFTGESGMFSGIDNQKQLTLHNFTGKELRRFVNFCIKNIGVIQIAVKGEELTMFFEPTYYK